MSIQPGAFLDALIAQEVLGITILGFTECEVGWTSYKWEIVQDSPDDWVEIRPVALTHCYCDDDDAHSFYRKMGHKEICLSVVPHYSTEIVHAWAIIDRFPHAIIYKYPDTRWAAWIGGVYQFADTAPLAICRAALERTL